MFEVREATAAALFKAQTEKAKGRLRLDISSVSFPRDLNRPLDIAAARLAIGRRFVEMVEQCAAEAATLGADREGVEPDAVPPLCRDGDLLPVMPHNGRFEPFVERRLGDSFGLDRQSEHYQEALALLADDLYEWCQGDDADADGFIAARGRVAIKCHVEPIGLEPLTEKATLWRERAAE